VKEVPEEAENFVRTLNEQLDESTFTPIVEAKAAPVKAAESSPRPSIAPKVVYYAQGDSRWGSTMYSKTKDKSQTIKNSGCGPTSMAMVVATLTDPTVTPPDMCNFATENGYRTKNSGTAWEFFPPAAEKYGLTCKQSFSTDEVVKALKNEGTLVIASMKKGYYTTTGHYILLTGTDGSNIFSHDPAKYSREKASINSVFKKQNRVYYIFTKK
jgi:hypothetical protein